MSVYLASADSNAMTGQIMHLVRGACRECFPSADDRTTLNGSVKSPPSRESDDHGVRVCERERLENCL
jgi:hypothetical protein